MVLALSGSSVLATVVYNNSVNDLGVNFNPGALEVGNEITLAAGPRTITNFVFQYYLTNPSLPLTGNESAEIRFYENNGPSYNGVPGPGTVFFDSGIFNIGALGMTSRSTLDFDLAALTTGDLVPLTSQAPDEFTWSIQFFNMSAGDDYGVSLYSPVTVGTGFYDYWQSNTVGGWTLETNANYPSSFAVLVEATPEPKPILLLGLGGLAVVGLALKRRLLARQ